MQGKIRRFGAVFSVIFAEGTAKKFKAPDGFYAARRFEKKREEIWKIETYQI